MKVIALKENGFVILKNRNDLEQIQSSRIVVPSGDDKSYIGEVVDVSNFYIINGIKFQTELKIGDIVVYPNFGTTKVKLDGKEYLFCKETEILGKIEI